MKRIMTIVVLALVIISASITTSMGATNGFAYKTSKSGKAYITRFYKGNECVGKVKTSKRLKVKVVKSESLTASQIEHRKDKYILVEVVNGKCINSKGDGETSDGYYISYSKVKGHKRGVSYTTHCVYGNNNYIDDVVIRMDYRK